MYLKRTVSAGVLAMGLGVAGLAGLGLGAAFAEPGGPCGAPNAPACQPAGPDQGPNRGPNRGPNQGPDRGSNQGPDQGPNQGPNQGPGPNQPPPPDLANRGIDQGRQDHRPFMYWGKQVNPLFDNGRGGWGFWFLNNWIPL